jgi:hypothetical protein
VPPSFEDLANPSWGKVDAVPPRTLEGQTVLEKAIIRLESCDSVSAKTRQSVELFGTRLIGSGSYIEQRGPRTLMFRLELRLQSGADASALVQTCDGAHLWLCEEHLGAQKVGQVDVARVARALEEKGGMPKPGMIGQWPGLGGLSKLLRGLDLAFDFPTVQQTRLEDWPPLVRIEGQWKPERLARLSPHSAEEGRPVKSVDLDKLPPYLPHYVVLFLERDGLFPRRIEYWRRQPTGLRQEEPAERQRIVSMDLFDVRINVPIDPARFRLDPGQLSAPDQTDRYLQDLGLK